MTVEGLLMVIIYVGIFGILGSLHVYNVRTGRKGGLPEVMFGHIAQWGADIFKALDNIWRIFVPAKQPKRKQTGPLWALAKQELLEHKALDPRTKEEWNHSKGCHVCHPPLHPVPPFNPDMSLIRNPAKPRRR